MRATLLVGPTALLGVWAVVTYTGLVRPVLVPTPGVVLAQMVHLVANKVLLADIGYTLLRLVLGFGLGALIGVPLGIVMGCSRRVYDSLEGLVDFFRSVPVTSLFPLFLLLFGLGDLAKVLIAAWSSSLLILINTMYGVRHSSATRQVVLRVMRASRYQRLTNLIIPDALPGIFVGFRTGISLALIVVVVSEMFLGTQIGLGQLIYNSSLLYESGVMYAAIAYAGLIGYGLNKLFIVVEKRVVHWAGR